MKAFVPARIRAVTISVAKINYFYPFVHSHTPRREVYAVAFQKLRVLLHDRPVHVCSMLNTSSEIVSPFKFVWHFFSVPVRKISITGCVVHAEFAHCLFLLFYAYHFGTSLKASTNSL